MHTELTRFVAYLDLSNVKDTFLSLYAYPTPAITGTVHPYQQRSESCVCHDNVINGST